MIYSINFKKVNKETFDKEFEKQLIEYIPYSEHWTKKEEVREALKTNRSFTFPIYDKRFKNRLVLKTKIEFVAVEEEIVEIQRIVESNQYDPEDGDSLRIAVALWNSGYRKNETKKFCNEIKEYIKTFKSIKAEKHFYPIMQVPLHTFLNYINEIEQGGINKE